MTIQPPKSETPIFEDCTDSERERIGEQENRAAIEAALLLLRAGDSEAAHEVLAARVDAIERCPICGVRDGEICDQAAHERAAGG